MGLGEGVPMTGDQSFQEPGSRDRNLSFLSLLPLWMNQTPPRLESARNWSHIPGYLPLLCTPQPAFRSEEMASSRIQGKEEDWVSGFCMLLGPPASEVSLSRYFSRLGPVSHSVEVPTIFRPGASNSVRKDRMLTET